MSEALEIAKAAGFDLTDLSGEQISLLAARILSNGWFRGEWRNPKYRYGLDHYPEAVHILRKMTQQSE